MMLDKAADELAKYWRCCTYDGHVVVPITVPSHGKKMNDEQDELLRFLAAPLRNFHTDKKLQSM